MRCSARGSPARSATGRRWCTSRPGRRSPTTSRRTWPSRWRRSATRWKGCVSPTWRSAPSCGPATHRRRRVRRWCGDRAVIVDEIHALARDKRGSHLALTLERLEHLAGRRLQRIGLSATQKPIEDIARFLIGAAPVPNPESRAPSIIDSGHARTLDLGIEIPSSPLEAVMAAEVWDEIYERLVQLISEHRTTLVFVNTRRLAERLALHLSERLGADRGRADRKSTRLKHSPVLEFRMPLLFFNDTATTEIYTLSLHDALPISGVREHPAAGGAAGPASVRAPGRGQMQGRSEEHTPETQSRFGISNAPSFF